VDKTLNTPLSSKTDLYLFDEAQPDIEKEGFKSECPPDKKVKVEDLFKFSRGRGDVQVSWVAAGIAVFFLIFFWTQTGWDNRKLPDELGAYFAHQFGLIELEGRVTRLGRILKQSWVAPMLCLLVLVPAALWNLRSSLKEHNWRKRFLLPTSAYFELTKYVAALEFVAYFIVYTLLIPWLGYLVSTLLMGTLLPWRLGYRGRVWFVRSLLSSLAVVIVFRTFLQIKTPVSIWLYDQLPTAMRGFMLTYF
jgi:hypothetical protein